MSFPSHNIFSPFTLKSLKTLGNVATSLICVRVLEAILPNLTIVLIQVHVRLKAAVMRKGLSERIHAPKFNEGSN